MPGLLLVGLRGQQRQVDLPVEAVLEVRARAAERGEARRPLGDEHLLVGDALRVAGDVQRAAAAVAEQRVVGGASSPCRGCGPTASLRSDVSNSSMTPAAACSTPRPAGRRPGAGPRARARSTSSVDLAAEEVVGVQPAEHEVQVGDRDRLDAALRPRGADHRARAVRADLRPPRVGVDADVGAAARADGVDLHERHVEHELRHVRRGRRRRTSCRSAARCRSSCRRCRCTARC